MNYERKYDENSRSIGSSHVAGQLVGRRIVVMDIPPRLDGLHPLNLTHPDFPLQHFNLEFPVGVGSGVKNARVRHPILDVNHLAGWRGGEIKRFHLILNITEFLLTDVEKILLGRLLGNLFRCLFLGCRHFRLDGLGRGHLDSLRLQQASEAGDFPLGLTPPRPSLVDLFLNGETVVVGLPITGVFELPLPLGLQLGVVVAVGLTPLDRLDFVIMIVAHCAACYRGLGVECQWKIAV